MNFVHFYGTLLVDVYFARVRRIALSGSKENISPLLLTEFLFMNSIPKFTIFAFQSLNLVSSLDKNYHIYSTIRQPFPLSRMATNN